MNLISEKHSLSGHITVPGSKSHTIRALVLASLAEGTSVIKNPLASNDCKSAAKAIQKIGAKISGFPESSIRERRSLVPLSMWPAQPVRPTVFGWTTRLGTTPSFGTARPRPDASWVIQGMSSPRTKRMIAQTSFARQLPHPSGGRFIPPFCHHPTSTPVSRNLLPRPPVDTIIPLITGIYDRSDKI